MIKTIIEAKRASENMVMFLSCIGAIYADESGIHASKEGRYRAHCHKKKDYPCTDYQSEQG